MRDLSKMKGCLLGGAVGDALGYPVEFMDEAEIFREFGPDGITRYRLDHGKALISDDTQMTLFTAVGLLFGQTRGMTRGLGGVHASYIRMAYLNWLDTQSHRFPYTPERYHVSWLANFEDFYHRRAPGLTCVSALESGEKGSVDHPINNSKGCGGVMRVAPIGLYLCDQRGWTAERIARLGAEAAAITHGHELGYIPAAALVHIIHAVASGEQTELLAAVNEAVDAMPELFPGAREMSKFCVLMNRAIELSQTATDDLAAIHTLGQGWVAEETLAIAVYCALKYQNDFETAVVTAVNHTGDSDSTGAVTGNILGAYLGAEAIPQYYLDDLELRDIIEEVAEDLYHDCQMFEYGDYQDPVWISKYIHIDYDAPKRREWRK